MTQSQQPQVLQPEPGDKAVLSVVIPAHNEEGCIGSTVRGLYETLQKEGIAHEIVVINDNSRDTTEAILIELQRTIPTLRYVSNPPPNGFGFAVRAGLSRFTGDAVAVYMADASDRPEDLVRYWRTLWEKNADCVFGNRWAKGARVVDYPQHKLFINRFANVFIAFLMGIRYYDTTNAFKMYRRHVIEGIQPLLSHHFNLTIELPLKAIVRGYSYAVVPNDWINRKTGISKLKIQEMGSRYLFILLYCLLEKALSRGDYHRFRHEKQLEAARIFEETNQATTTTPSAPAAQ
jgi:dolichol-phosphate mannosyltransferase